MAFHFLSLASSWSLGICWLTCVTRVVRQFGTHIPSSFLALDISYAGMWMSDCISTWPGSGPTDMADHAWSNGSSPFSPGLKSLRLFRLASAFNELMLEGALRLDLQSR
jgi:hypothetical protein